MRRDRSMNPGAGKSGLTRRDLLQGTGLVLAAARLRTSPGIVAQQASAAKAEEGESPAKGASAISPVMATLSA